MVVVHNTTDISSKNDTNDVNKSVISNSNYDTPSVRTISLRQDDEDDDDFLPLTSLHDLFTVKEYATVNVQIPLYCAASSSGGDTECDGHPFLDSVGPPQQASTTHTGTSQLRAISMDILQSPAACTDPDLTGEVLWPVSQLLSHYIASNRHKFRDAAVLELGAGGTGVPSITAYYCNAAIVVATDGNDNNVLKLLHRNIDYHYNHQQQHQHQLLNDGRHSEPHGCSSVSLLSESASASSSFSSCFPKLSCRQLLWGNRIHVQCLRQEMEQYHRQRSSYGGAAVFDYILAADVVQWPAVLEPLLHTVKAFMWPMMTTIKASKHHFIARNDNDDDGNNYINVKTEECPQPHPRRRQSPLFILGIVERSTSIHEQFVSLASSMGFTIRLIDNSEYLPDGQVPISCQEYGGRVTKLFEMSLQLGSSVVPTSEGLNRNNNTVCLTSSSFDEPVLLTSSNKRLDNGDDVEENDDYYTLGKLYQRTTFLPC